MSKMPASFDENFEQLSMNSKIEAEKFEPKPTFEKTINDIKDNHLKSVTSIAMNILAITLNKPSSSSEHLKDDLIKWILLQSPVKSPQFTKYLDSMHRKGNNQLQTQNWLVTLISAFYPYFFGCNFVNNSL